MTRLDWDKVGERFYEAGVDRGVLYIPDNTGAYDLGVAWNGLTTVTESPSGAEPSPQYADNIKYLNLTSAEEFGATIEAFTYPVEFAQFDGQVIVGSGITLGQQGRRSFGLSYRTRIGNDVSGADLGYKIHLVYGCQAAPSEKAYTTINDSPEALAFSWELSTTPVAVSGYKPTAIVTIDSTKESPANMAALEDALYGTAGGDPRLPLPNEVLAMFAGALTTVTTQAPTYNNTTDIITIPAVTGVVYKINGETVPSGPFGPISVDTVVTAVPAAGYRFSNTSDTDWTIVFS